MAKSALVILAEGAEEMETVITVDVLRRGGVDVVVGGLSGNGPVRCSRNMVLVPDKALSDVSSAKFDAVVLPGGAKGAQNLAESKSVGDILKKHEKESCIIAAICAAPIALKSHGVCASKKITSHPTVKEGLESAGYKYSEDRVVVDGNTITSRGPGTAFEFALALVGALQGENKIKEISPPMLLK